MPRPASTLAALKFGLSEQPTINTLQKNNFYRDQLFNSRREWQCVGCEKPGENKTCEKLDQEAEETTCTYPQKPQQ